MKLSKKNIWIAGISAIMLASCSDDFITTEPLGYFSAETFYKNEGQALGALAGVYDPIRKNSNGLESIIMMFNSGSDDHYAGGGGSSDVLGLQAMNTFTLTSENVPITFWADHYQGVERANSLIANIGKASIADANKTRYTAEAKTLRALYYFNLVRMFGNVPLILNTIGINDIANVEQAKPEEVYAQIEKDLNEAIPNLPATLSASEKGRMTKASAQALLGKVLLYEKKNAQAATVLAEVNGTPGQPNQYGNELLKNFADLWVVENKFNKESLIEVAHTNQSNNDWGFWQGGKDEGNTVNIMCGPRNYEKVTNDAEDIPSGWSFNTVTENLHDFMLGDPRYAATILDLKTLKEEGKVKYIAGYQDTGYFMNKFVPRQKDVFKSGNTMLNFQQNTYVIRLADTYLMEAEALGATGARAQALLDAVRARVGLPSVPVTMDAIKAERRKELASEGHRFFDLVRWGDAPSVLSFKGFVAGKNEVLPIPLRELLGTKLKQNPGYH